MLLKTLDKLNRYGEEQLTAIAEHFQASVTKEKLESEWSTFKHVLVDNFKHKSSKGVKLILSRNSSLSVLYETLSMLASITLVLPVSTANFERGFSIMKENKEYSQETIENRDTGQDNSTLC